MNNIHSPTQHTPALYLTPSQLRACTSLSFSRWESFPFNYDSFGNAALVVFEVSSGEMWPDIMYATIDAVGPGEPMQKDYNRSSALYFIMVHLVISFLVRATRRESKMNRKRIVRESKENERVRGGRRKEEGGGAQGGKRR